MTFTLMPDGVVVMRVKNKHVSELAGFPNKKGREGRARCAAVALMLGIDTNILVRYIVGDDRCQQRAAKS